MSEHWTVVLPFRGGAGNKSRLAATLHRPDLAADLTTAMLFDAATAALHTASVGQVVLLCGDPPQLPPDLRNQVRLALVRPRRPGLNEALRGWLDTSTANRVAVVLPDLPTLSAPLLGAALDEVDALLTGGAPAVVVPDRATGTAMLAGPAARLRPRFGPDSARRHEATGAVRWDPVDDRLQADVDTATDLQHAHALGLGRYTTAALSGDDGSVAARG